jgi:O-methyltransferase
LAVLKKLIGSALRGSPPAAARSSAPAEPASSPAPAPPAKAPRWTYSADGFATTHNAAFLGDPRFRAAYGAGVDSGHRICAPKDLHIEWRVYVCCWAAEHALRLAAGDFVECGVSTGIVSRAVTRYVDFGACDRRFWLVDTFEGIPLEQASPSERKLAESKNERHYFDCSAEVRAHFASMANVEVVKGRVPDVLPSLAIDRVAYLHIDMNIAAPEVAAAEHFWDRLVCGAVVVLDDYGSLAHVEQKAALDEFARARGVAVMTLPTGQGLLIRP